MNWLTIGLSLRRQKQGDSLFYLRHQVLASPTFKRHRSLRIHFANIVFVTMRSCITPPSSSRNHTNDGVRRNTRRVCVLPSGRRTE